MRAIECNTARADPFSSTSSGLLPSKVAIIMGNDNYSEESKLQVRRMLENKGLVYDIVGDTNQSSLKRENFCLIIVLGPTHPQFGAYAADLRSAVEKGAGLIWVGQGLPETLYDLVGLTHDSSKELAQDMIKIEYGDASTLLFGETVEFVDFANASVKGSFVGNADNFVAPAELSFKKGSSGLTYFFAYDVCSWWFADQAAPWLRAYRLHLAMEDVLSEHFTVRLSPYPRNMQSVFAVRVEDVDPLHTDPNWINRAADFLNYYSNKNLPLTVTLTPTYVDPSLGLNFGIEEPRAQALKDWLSNVLMRGGTIVEHGYTHQIGNEKTGDSPEFFNPETQTWLSFENQKMRIETGAKQIYNTFGFSVKGFESPHYIANNDTYEALFELGFQYVTHNSNTAFIDRYDLRESLVNVPETLGYIPLNAAKNVNIDIISNMEILYNMSGVMLYFNHLFDEQMLETGEELLDHALAKEGVWIANIDNIADFSIQRFKAYKQMMVNASASGNEVVVSLGSSNRAGLTLALSNAPQIEYVNVNGAPWSVFDGNWVILPVLPESSNTIIIGFKETDMNANQVYGYSLVIASFLVSLFLVPKALGLKGLKITRAWRKK